jgi:hypothetical protein
MIGQRVRIKATGETGSIEALGDRQNFRPMYRVLVDVRFTHGSGWYEPHELEVEGDGK